MSQNIEELWDEFHDRLLAFIRSKVNNQQDAEDILQQVFIKIHKKINTVQDEDKLVSWVYQVARNTINDCYRSCYKHKEVKFDESYMQISPQESKNLNTEIIRGLKGFTQLLSEDDREIIRMHDFQHLKHREIAKKLGISENTSKSKLKRAKERLKKQIFNCCDFTLDHYGNVVDYERKDDCGNC
ncbi:MAG: RNA polymerase sigma factor SigZ [Lentisphaeria bacterium]|nr:RNA polymerase sigma factor SigZ [Lentisphaeria bacterium]